MSAIQSILIIDTGQTDAVSACSFSGAGSTGVQFNSTLLKPVNGDILYTDYVNSIVFNGDNQFFKETGANGTETFKVDGAGVVSEVATCTAPTATPVPVPSTTPNSAPVATPTATPVPVPTATVPDPTAPVATPTATPVPVPTATVPDPTAIPPTPTPVPDPTATVPDPTAIPPTPTPVPDPTATGNAAPTVADDTVNVIWGTTGTAITLVGDDGPDTASLTYTIVTQPTKGTVSLVGNTATYIHTATTIGSDSFTFIATDNSSLASAPGTITINPLNAAPIISSPGTITVTQNSFVNFNIIASDADGDTVVFSIVSNPTNGALSDVIDQNNQLSVKYTPGVGYSGSDSFSIKCVDSKGATSSTLSVSIVVDSTPWFEINIGSFGNDAEALCIANRNGTAYGDTSQANTLAELSIGDTIYYDSELTSKVTAPSTTTMLVPVSDSSTISVFKISSSGEIEEIIPCGDETQSSYANVQFSTNTITYCAGDYQNIKVWYAGAYVPGTVLGTLVTDNTPLFSSEYYSNLYTVTGGESLLGAIDSGIYSTFNNNVYYKRSSFNTWGLTDANELEWECEGDVINTTHVLDYIDRAKGLDEPNINQFCVADKEAVSLHYTRPLGLPSFTDLLSLASANTLIYKSQDGATAEDQDDLFASNIFEDSIGYLVWENIGDSVNNKWYGYDGNGLLASGTSINNHGTCDDYVKPDITINNQITETDPSPNDVNVFYGFYSCSPEIQGPVAGSVTETLAWPIYVIDGLHTSNFGDNGSYIKEFIKTISFGDTIKSDGFDRCLEYAFQIRSENIDTAIELLNNQGLNSRQVPVASAAIEIGLGSESVIDVYNTDFAACIIDDKTEIYGTYTFPIVAGYETISAGPNFNTQKNYKLDNVAKPLLRTNPKLSGNIKIVTSSDGTIYLESISATKDLAATRYKKSPINSSGNYSHDVSKFFKSNGTPSDLIYLTKRQESDLTVLDSYDKQVEEEYQYGTSYNYSKNYEEDLRMFAPIWADNNMPNNFVIFKVTSPTGVDASSIDGGNFNRVQDLLKNAEIIKTFDLTSNSNLGEYIRRHVQQETFPKSPISVSFGKNETTNYNGVDLSSGELTSKGEYIYKDFVETDKPLIEANDFITDGFKRNNMLCANLLNLEFLFNDDTAEDYSVNRYFGLYVDDIDSGTGEIAAINNNLIRFSELASIVDPNDSSTAIPTYKQMSTTPTLGYVNINDIFYKIANSGIYNSIDGEIRVDDSTGNIQSTIGISHNGNSVNLTNNEDRGYDFVKMSIIGTPDSSDKIAVVEAREETYKFTFVKHTPGESINIQMDDLQGTYNLFDSNVLLGSDFEATVLNMVANRSYTTDSEGRPLSIIYPLHPNLNITFDYNTKSVLATEIKTNLADLNMRVIGTISSIVRVDQIQTNINIQDRTYSANYTLPSGTYREKQFSSNGTSGQIAAAIAAAIHNDDSQLDAYNIGSDIWVKSRVAGYRLMQHAVLVSKSNVIDFIKVENEDIYNLLKLREGNDTISSKWRSYYLNGGHSSSKSVYVDNVTLSEISSGDSLETRHVGVYNKVLDIVEDISVVNSDKTKLILEGKSDIKNGNARVFNQRRVRIGLFSAYDIYDMNFDFYDTSNSDLKELELETRANINYEPYENAMANIDPITGEFNTRLEATDIFDDNYSLDAADYFSNLSGILSEESTEEGLSERVTSEFDRLKENQLKEFATNSRIVPNINKWVLKDTLTVREQPYYLNANEVFGRTNFSPDLTTTGRKKDDMTHEWFYMDKKPKYLKYNELNETFSYINYIEDFELTSDLFKSTTNDYFDKFMITEGFEKNLNEEDLIDIYTKSGKAPYEGYLNKDDVNNTFFKTNLKKKYTLIDGGDSGSFASTIFKGLKFVLKNRKEFTNPTALDFVKGSEFNGYRFSVLLKTNTDSNTNGVDFEIIQNKKFKFVIFFINLNISDYWIKGNMNRKLLYELNHKIVYDHGSEDYIYANTLFDGALNWNQVDFSSNSPYSVEGISHFDGSEPKFDDQILLNENGLYGDVIMDLYPNAPGNTLYKFSIFSVVNSNTIRVVSKPVEVNNSSIELEVAYLPNYIQKQIKYYYADGGTNIHKSVLEQLSINNVANLINLNNDSITYTTVEESGIINNNRFTVNIEDGTEIIKYANLSVEEDNDKPKSYKLFKGIIGYNLVESQDTSYYPFLIRHNGAYTVDFTPVITFTDMYTHFKSNRIQVSVDQREIGLESELYKHSIINEHELRTAKSYYNRYNRCGTSFNLGFIQDNGNHELNWGIIKNHFYHKVNEINPSGITKLSRSSDKLPLYPLIDEITIAKKDINIFKSSWDAGYYTRAYSSGKSEGVPGTLNNTEEKSYLASTIMKVKDEYDITSFTYQSVDNKEELDEILRNSINKSEVVFFEDKNSIIADFYITDASVRLLKNDGVLSKIQQYVLAQNSAGDKTTLDDDAEFYINKNIVQQFVVDSVLLYTKKFKGAASSIIDTPDANLIASSGFSPDNNFAYKPHKQKPMNFRLIYNKRLGYSYDIKPMIKIKS